MTRERHGFSVGGRLGVALGLAHERITEERRLVDAIAWVNGGPAAAQIRLPRRVTVRNLRVISWQPSQNPSQGGKRWSS